MQFSRNVAININIRAARASDADSVGELAQQFANYLRELGDRTDFNLNAATFLRDGFGATPAVAGIVAEEEGRVIGYLLYHFGYDSDRAARTLQIADLYVDRTKRNQGAGRALMAEAAKIARQSGADEMIWSVYHANDLGKRFYERMGAQRITDVFFMKMKTDAM